MTRLHLPATFRKQIINTFGEQGQMWITNLPSLIVECEKRFNLKIGSRFEHQSFNFTALAKQIDGAEIVIKLCVPTKEVEN